MEQNTNETPVTQQTKAQESQMTFRDYVDMSTVFVCIPALVLNVLLWAVATAFPQAGVLPTILSLLITLLLSLVGGILIARYVDRYMIHIKKVSSSFENERPLWLTIGSGALCTLLAGGIVGSLSTAGALAPWQYMLLLVEVLLVGYQARRTLTGRNKQPSGGRSGDDPTTSSSSELAERARKDYQHDRQPNRRKSN